MPLTGSCNCEAIKVTISDAGLKNNPTAYCHCANCRNQSGARGSYVMAVSNNELEVSGKPKVYLDKKTDSGNPLERLFCGDCGCPIMSVIPSVEGKSFVKMGLFPKIPAPAVEVYTRNRDDWEPPLANAAQIEGSGK